MIPFCGVSPFLLGVLGLCRYKHSNYTKDGQRMNSDHYNARAAEAPDISPIPTPRAPGGLANSALFNTMHADAR